MRVHLILFSCLAVASLAHASDETTFHHCASLLRQGQSSLSVAQIENLISSEIVDTHYPATLRREYLGDDQIAVTLTYSVQAPQSRADRQLTLSLAPIEGDRAYLLLALIKLDLAGRNSQIKIYPISNSGDVDRSPTTRLFGVFSGFRHPLTAKEAAAYFGLLDGALSRALPSIRTHDVLLTKDSSTSRSAP